MTKAIYPGSFDPVTLGHLDIIRRASNVVDHLIVGVLNNQSKRPMFTVKERVEMLKKVTEDIPNVEVLSFSRFCTSDKCSSNCSWTSSHYRF